MEIRVEEGARERARNIRTALLLKTVLELGVASTIDIAEALAKEGGVKRNSAMNIAFALAEDLTRYGILERVGAGRPARYRVTPFGAIFLLAASRGRSTVIVSEELVLDYIARQEPSLYTYILGYRQLKSLIPEDEEKDATEDLYGFLKWAEKIGLWKPERYSWPELLESIIEPLRDFILHGKAPIPSSLPNTPEARETWKKALEMAEEEFEEEEKRIKTRLLAAKSLLSV